MPHRRRLAVEDIARAFEPYCSVKSRNARNLRFLDAIETTVDSAVVNFRRLGGAVPTTRPEADWASIAKLVNVSLRNYVVLYFVTPEHASNNSRVSIWRSLRNRPNSVELQVMP